MSRVCPDCGEPTEQISDVDGIPVQECDNPDCVLNGGGEETVEVPLEDFAFWQAEMAHASARATNDPNHDGVAIHRAHDQMLAALRGYHEEGPDPGGDVQ